MQPCGRNSRWAAAGRRRSAGQRVVAPLSGDRIGAGEDLPVDDDTAADAGAEDHAEHHLRAAPPRRRSPRTARSSWHRWRAAPRAAGALPGRAAAAWPIRQVELAFLIRPVARDCAPGMPMPTVPRGPFGSARRPARRPPRGCPRSHPAASACGGAAFPRRPSRARCFDLGAAEVDADAHGSRCYRRGPLLAAAGRYRFEAYASSSRLRSGMSCRIRRPNVVSACRRPGVCGGGSEWKRDSWVTRSWKIGAGAGPAGRSQT